MTTEKVLSRSIRLLCAGGMLFGMNAWAQEQQAVDPGIQRVEITGSSIKRIAAEASLPVQTFNQKDIQRTGVNSVTDFIQQLPVMQGFTVAADSVGGGGGGITTASIHDVGSSYTLVLLNGRRIAPATSGTTIDVNSIPLSAVERIEVLTDGASALYGADAIAGVVNFILKKGAAPLTVDAKVTKPQHPGAGGKSFSISKGLGDLDTDGYSLYLSASRQTEDRLKASQRDFAKTGIINFRDPASGQQLQFFNGSSRSIPPNISVRYKNTAGANKTVNINPYLKINKKCAPAHVDLGDGRCYFDYTTTVEIAPEIQRDGAYVNGELKLGESGFKLFGNVAYNEAHVYATIAPYPAEFSLAKSSPLFGKYVQPYLTAEQLNGFTGATVAYRLQDLGGRAYDYMSRTTHMVAGIEGAAFGWDINSAFTWSRNHSPQNYVSGFPLADKFEAAMAAGTIDPFPYALGQMPADMVTALKATQYSGNYNTTDILMKGVDVRASRSVFNLPAGAAQLGVGADWRTNSYEQRANKAVANAEILFDDPQAEFDFSRESAGAFAELLVPVAKDLDVTASVRYDRVSKITDSLAKDITVGKNQSATTYKISARWQPTKTWLLRGAYGTGFKVASMLQIGQPQTDFGVTGGSYQCPLNAANGLANHPLAQYCPDGKGQLEAFTGGNPDLGPEKSKQWTVGTVFEPTNWFSAKFDLWHVGIDNAITSVSEGLIASNPNKYISLYTTKYKASTGQKTLAILFAPINIGSQENRGLDYDFLLKNNVAGAKLTTRLAGTWLIKSRYTTPGTSDQWETSLGQFGSNDAVSFRHVFRASSTAEIGRWTHTLAANFRSGYKDKAYTADDCSVTVGDALGDCADVQLTVPKYYTFDWQTQFRLLKNLSVTGGITNLADKKPPLSLRNTGSHQLGYDPRYASPIGRTFYLSAQYQY